MNINLRGQVILLTGASRGIGLALAEGLAGAGATLALHYRSRAKETEALADRLGNSSRAFQADLGNPEAASRLLAEVLSHFHRIDTLVNNAGIALPESEALDPQRHLAIWQQTLQVNLIAAAQLCHGLVPFFKENGGGRFIHIASRAAFRGDTPQYLAYAASKGGMVALSRSLARGYGKDGIKSFLVAPGFVKTDMAQQFIDEYGEDYVRNDLALDELTLPIHLAPSVVLMASGQMDNATGATLDLNAGSYVH
ncbi:MAG: SDR family oxidoreductase [Bacteroidota bacterium]